MVVKDDMRVVTLAVVFVLSGCRHADAGDVASERRYEPGCSFGEKTAAVCDAMQEGVLLDQARRATELTVTSRWMPGLFAQVAWGSRSDPGLKYHALLKFTADGPQQSRVFDHP